MKYGQAATGYFRSIRSGLPLDEAERRKGAEGRWKGELVVRKKDGLRWSGGSIDPDNCSVGEGILRYMLASFANITDHKE